MNSKEREGRENMSTEYIIEICVCALIYNTANQSITNNSSSVFFALCVLVLLVSVKRFKR